LATTALAELVSTMLASIPCASKTGCGLVGEHKVGSDVDLEGEAPHGIGDDAVGRRGEDGGGVDEDVEAAELADGFVQGGADGLAVADVDGDAADGLLAGNGAGLVADGFGGLEVAVGDHDVGAALGREQGDFAADAAASADDHHDAAAKFLLRGLAADLGLFELPVLDAEGFAGGQGNVVGVGLELAGGAAGRPGECPVQSVSSLPRARPRAPAPRMTPMALV
jgi:hypothetical protein